MDGPLNDTEQQTFFSLLRRVCDYHVDQWEQLRVGEFFVDISLKPRGSADEYVPIGSETRLGNHWRVVEAMKAARGEGREAASSIDDAESRPPSSDIP